MRRSKTIGRASRRGGCALLLAGLVLACAPDAEVQSSLRYDDLITDGLLTSNRRIVVSEQAYCSDEMRFSTPIEGGEELTAVVELDGPAELTISGCLGPRPRAEVARGGGAVEIAVESVPGSQTVTERVEVGRLPRWWRRTLDLGSVPAGRVRIRIRAELPAERKIFLQDLFVRQQTQSRVESPAPPAGPQILLISIDTLRADAIGRFGGEWETPHLDQLVDQAEVWRTHYAAANWTKPSHGSLLTGQHPSVHGAASHEAALHPGVPTLAERFREAGLSTGGLVFDCLWLDPRFGFARGFDTYRSVHWTLPQMARRTVDWAVGHQEEPFFFFLHTFEAHSDFRILPYEAPSVRRLLIKERFGVDNYGCRERSCASGLLRAIDSGAVEPLENEEEILRFLYGEGVRHIDRELGRLFEDLEAAGLFDQLTIVVTSDHGESFFEHDRLLHHDPWIVVAQVPLIIKWPGGERAGRINDEPTASIDVVPTLLSHAGLATGDLPGIDLDQPVADRAVFTSGVGVDAIARDRYRAIIDRDTGAVDLFDVIADPNELTDLAAERPQVVAAFESLLAELKADAERRRADLDGKVGAPDSREISPAERKRLEALGYVGG